MRGAQISPFIGGGHPDFANLPKGGAQILAKYYLSEKLI